MRVTRLIAVVLTIGLAATTIDGQESATFEIVSSFEAPFIVGRSPSSLREIGGGDLLGTTTAGGTFDKGTLFRLDRFGTIAVLHFFGGFNDGARPFALVRTPLGTSGRFYGLTSEGGAFGRGTVFKYAGVGGTITTLHAFSENDGSPVDLYATSDGNVYGLTTGGGDFGIGTIFHIDPTDNVSRLHNLPPGAGSGMTSLVRGSDGKFYGTAAAGGDPGFGTIFTIDAAGTLTVLHNFAGRAQADGEVPLGLMQGRDGRLYGTTRAGGQHGAGTVYSIDATGDYRVLHSFDASIDGAEPGPDLLQADDGNFYGVTQSSAASTLFRIDSGGVLTVLNDLSAMAPGGLIQSADGRVFAPTAAGGIDGAGSIIAKHPTETTVTFHYQFRMTQAASGRPTAVMQARNGLFYGATVPTSAPGNGSTEGTLFVMDAAGTRTTVHVFGRDLLSHASDGRPNSALFEGADGSLFGTTWEQIYKLGAEGEYTRIAAASGIAAGVIQVRDGRLYGVLAASGAADPHGSVFRVEAGGAITILHQFNGTDGEYPSAELAEIDDGSLYGTTAGNPSPDSHGTVFRLDPANGSVTPIHRFTGVDGSKPWGRLMQASDGLIYGTTLSGGVHNRGTVFSLDASGTLTTIHHFSGPDGARPLAGVTQGFDGRLYGVTANGGAFGYESGRSGAGTVFVLNLTGGLTTLHSFSGPDGAEPQRELIQATDGAFYGVTEIMGPSNGGTIFRVRYGTAAPTRYHEIVSRHSGKCLDLAGGSTEPGAPVVQWTCHGGPNQQWRLEPAGGGAMRLISRYTGQALDVAGGSIDDGVAVVQWPVHGGDNQAWTLEPAFDGYVRLVVRHSGKAMDVESGSTGDGARVLQWSPHSGANQQWLLRPVN